MSKGKFKPDNTNQSLIFGYNVEDFLPNDHIARVIEEIVNEIDTCKIEEKYSSKGQKSYEPKVMIKIIFYGYSLGICSSRKIAQGCKQDIAFMYLARLYKPNFRTISDFRKNHINELTEYFVDIIKYCKEIGLVKVGSIAIDGTKIRANASTDKMKSYEELERWEKEIKEQIRELNQKGINQDEEETKRLEEKEFNIPKELQKRENLLCKIKAAKESINLQKETIKYKRKKIIKSNITDPDSRFMKGISETVKANYNVQVAANESQIILAANISQKANDREELVPMIEKVENNTQEPVKEVLADCGYSSYENYKKISDKKIDGYIPDQEYKRIKNNKKNPYDKENFKYDSKNDCYICPEEKLVKYYKRYHHSHHRKNFIEYKGKECSQCIVKNKCTKAKYRTIARHEHDYLQKKMRKKLKTVEGKEKYKKRLWMIETVFGHIKKNLGFKQFLLRGINKVKGELHLLCIGFNLMKIYRWKLANN